MKLEEFNQKYRNSKKDDVWKASKEAVEIMKKSHDPVHDIKHVENVFKNLDLILTNLNKPKIDFDVLMLSVCWHDVYKASNWHGNIIQIIYRHIVEGIASAHIFNKGSKKYSLPAETVKGVCYAIRKHSQIQFTPRKTIEAKLLDDADKIDALNYERLKNTRFEEIIFSKKIYIKIAISYFESKKNRSYFSENTPIFNDQKNDFLAYLKAKL